MAVTYDLERDPNAFTDVEQEMADAINAAGEKKGGISVGAAALAIGAGFVLYRRWMSRRLTETIADDPRNYTTSAAVGELAIKLFDQYADNWAATTAVGIAVAYTTGLVEAGANGNPEWARMASLAYAQQMGKSINDTSVSALVEGMQAQINRGVAERVATERALKAFGVNKPTMKALVSMWTKTPTRRMNSLPTDDDIVTATDKKIARALIDRARVVGDTEANLSANAAKSLYWAWQEANGQIPPTAEKEWITADDERTCPVCAPLHHQRVLVSARFETSIGPIMAPGVHPNCRCQLRLHLNIELSDLMSSTPKEKVGKSVWGVVHKARGADSYSRDKNGQFSAMESRGPGEMKQPKDRFKVYGQRREAPQQAAPKVEEPKMQTLPQSPLAGKGLAQSPLSQQASTLRSLQTPKLQGNIQISSLQGKIELPELQGGLSMQDRIGRLDLINQAAAALTISENTRRAQAMLDAAADKDFANATVMLFAANWGTFAEESMDDEQMEDKLSETQYDFIDSRLGLAYQVASDIFANHGKHVDPESEWDEAYNHRMDDSRGNYDDDEYDGLDPTDPANWNKIADKLHGRKLGDLEQRSKMQRERDSWLDQFDKDELYTKYSLRDGRNVYLTESAVWQVANAIEQGDKDHEFIEEHDVIVAPGGGGFVTGPGANYVDMQQIYEAMYDDDPDSAEALVREAVDARTISIINPDGDTIDDGALYTAIEPHMEAMREAPWSWRLASKQFEAVVTEDGVELLSGITTRGDGRGLEPIYE